MVEEWIRRILVVLLSLFLFLIVALMLAGASQEFGAAMGWRAS